MTMRPTLIAAGIASLALLAVPAHAAGFKLSSPEIKAGAMMPKSFEFNGFGCAGEN
jgi:hypothetical protein